MIKKGKMQYETYANGQCNMWAVGKGEHFIYKEVYKLVLFTRLSSLQSAT